MLQSHRSNSRRSNSDSKKSSDASTTVRGFVCCGLLLYLNSLQAPPRLDRCISGEQGVREGRSDPSKFGMAGKGDERAYRVRMLPQIQGNNATVELLGSPQTSGEGWP